MEMELLDARSLQRALRKVFGVEETGYILTVAGEVRGQLTKVKKDLWTSQKEYLDTKAKAQETMVALTKLLAGQTSATIPILDWSPTRKKRRFITINSLSSKEDASPTPSTSGANFSSSKEWGVKVHKRHRGFPVNLPGMNRLILLLLEQIPSSNLRLLCLMIWWDLLPKFR